MTAQDRQKLAETVKAGAHFYMAHKMREYPHPDVPEITMGEHKPDDPDCPGCKAEAALDALAQPCQECDRLWMEARGLWSGSDPRIVTLRRERDAAEDEVAALREKLAEAERWANTMEHERDWEKDVVHSDLLARAEQAEAKLAEAERERELARQRALLILTISRQTYGPIGPRLRRIESEAEHFLSVATKGEEANP